MLSIGERVERRPLSLLDATITPTKHASETVGLDGIDGGFPALQKLAVTGLS